MPTNESWSKGAVRRAMNLPVRVGRRSHGNLVRFARPTWKPATPPKPEDALATSLFTNSPSPADAISSGVARQNPLGANTLGASIVSTTKALGGLDHAHPHSEQARNTFPSSRPFTNIANPALAQTEQSPAEYIEPEAISSPAQRTAVKQRPHQET
jgi:hypothetical protein